MKKLKKVISLVLAVALLSTLIPQITIAESEGFYENFESMTEGSAPESNSYNLQCLSGTGSIVTEKHGDNKVASIKNYDEGTYVMLKSSFASLKGAISAGADFCQHSSKSNGNIIIRLMQDDIIGCSVETLDGDIVFKQSGEDITIVSDYELDAVYSIKLEISIVTGLIDVYVNDELACQDAGMLNSFTALNEFRTFTTSAPGFDIDNIYVKPSTVVAYGEVSGSDVLSVPPEGKTQKYTYEAKAFSDAGDVIDSAVFEWSVVPDDGKVALNTIDEKTATLEVSSNVTPESEYSLRAKVGGATVVVEKKLTVKTAVFDKMEIRGKGSLSLELAKIGDEYEYTADIYDEFGNKMDNEEVVWEISGEGAGCFGLNPETGVLTVEKTGNIVSDLTIKASLKADSSKYATRKISLIDVTSYINDDARRKILKTYLDTVLEYAKDVYNGSPRLADGINRDGEAIKWRTQNRDEIPTSDLGNEWELLRTMIAYSDTLGDPFYKERAYEIYRYTLEHDVSDNGLIYWGSHRAVDLRTGEATPNDVVLGIGRYHEIEEKDMYFTPFYEIDPEMTAQLVRNIWMGHILEEQDANKNPLGWKTLNFNRHANYTKEIDESLQKMTWDNVDAYNEDYYLDDPFYRVKAGGSPFFLAASEYISAAVELYERQNDEKALLWAKRLAYRFANLADKKTGVMPKLTSTPYGSPDIVDENGNLSFNTRPKWVDSYTRLPDGMGSKKYGDQVYVQFAQGMEDAGLLDGFKIEEHLPLPKDPVLRQAIIDDGAKGLILDMYYYRKWPWAYGRSMFAVLELMEALGLENAEDEGFDLFAKWMRGYKSYLEFAYAGDSKISVAFASGVKLDGYVTTVPGSESNKGSVLDKTEIGLETVLPAIRVLSMLERFDPSTVIFAGNEVVSEVMTIGDVEETVWDFVNAMAEAHELGYLGKGRSSEGTIEPEPNYNTTCDDANGLNTIIELYRLTGNDKYLKLARVIANNIIEEKYSGGLFIPEDQYGTWTSSYIAAVLMKLDAIINNTWSDALNFSFESYVYHQAYYIDDHGVIPTKQHESRHEEEYAKVLAKKILVDTEQLTMAVGESKQLGITVLPDDANSKSYYWEISDPSVVQTNGSTVYAVGKGEAIIRAVVNDTNVESADIHITVE